MAGVIVHFYSGLFLSFTWLICSLIVLVILSLPLFSSRTKTNSWFLIVMICCFFQLGGYLANINKSSTNLNYFEYQSIEKNNVFDAYILESPEEKENSVKCLVEVQSVNGSASMGKSLVYFEKDSAALNLKYGQVVSFSAIFNPISQNKNPHEFDYKRYLEIHDIRCQAYVSAKNWILSGDAGNSTMRGIYDLRNYLSQRLKNSGLSDKNFMVANALLLGQKEYLDKEVLRSYSSAGAMHVLAVSGLHVGIVMLILAFFLTPIKKVQRGKIVYLICLIAGIWFYALITGLSPSVLRASVMFSFIIFGKELQRETTVYQSIMVSAFLLILIEPYIIFQVGFQLSYLAVIGIVYLQPKIVNLIYIKNFILDKAWQITAVSIAAQIATFPLGLYYFHQFPNFFMISNLIVIPAAFLLLILGVAYFVLHLVPLLSDVILFLFDKMLTVLNWGVEFVQDLPYSIVWGISIAWYEVILVYMALVLISLGLVNKKIQYVFVSLVLTLFLVGFNIYEKVRISNQDYAFIYNVKDDLAIDVFKGPENTFYSSKSLLEDDEKLLFHVKHNWFYRSGREEAYHWKDISKTDLIALGDYSLLSLNGENHDSLLTRFPITDFVLISEIEYISSELIEIMKFYPTKIIIGSGVNYKVQNYLKSQIVDSKLHDLRTDGAFQLDLNDKI